MQASDRRQQFAGNKESHESVGPPQLAMTVLFWGLWIYLMVPLVSLGFWFGGVYLFLDRMVLLGGYQELIDKAYQYSSAIIVMWSVLGAWVLWNKLRYGNKNRRQLRPPHLSQLNLKKSTGLDYPVLDQLRHSKEIFLHFDDGQKPVIESRPLRASVAV